MPSRAWITVAAAGWLIAGSSLGQAQEQAQDAQRGAGQKQQTTTYSLLPFPVDIIEDEATAEARKQREEETAGREIRDLAAQEGMNAATQAMNEATQRMAKYAFWSTVLVALGTALLIVTLWLTRQANAAARAAVDVTRDIGQRQLRAYVGISKIIPCADNQGGLEYTIEIKNFGSTPARNVVAWNRMDLIGKDDPGDWIAAHPKSERRFTLWPGQSEWMIALGDVDVADDVIIHGEERHLLCGAIEYLDVFGERHTTKFRYRRDVAFREEQPRLHLCAEGNDAD